MACSFRISIKLLMVVTTAWFAMVMASIFGYNLAVMQRNSKQAIQSIDTRTGNAVLSELTNILSNAEGVCTVLSQALQGQPPPGNVPAILLQLLKHSETASNYVELATITGDYYALSRGMNGGQWTFSAKNATFACRIDFGCTLSAATARLTIGGPTTSWCGYDPLQERWVEYARNLSSPKTTDGLSISPPLPRVGVTTGAPPSALSFAVPLKTSGGGVFGYLSLSVALDAISKQLSALAFEGSSGVAVWDAETRVLIAGSWLPPNATALSDTASYDATVMQPTVSYYTIDALPTTGALAHPLLLDCLRALPAVPLAPHDLLVPAAYRAPLALCRVQDIVLPDPSLTVLKLRTLTFVDHTFYTADMAQAQRKVIAAIVCAIALMVIVQGLAMFEMTRSINSMERVVHETVTQQNGWDVDEDGAETSKFVMRSHITEIAAMEDKLENFGRTMNQYVPSEVVAELILSGNSADVCMVQTYATILFVDIESFTSLCEAIETLVLSEVLRYYYDIQCAFIMSHGGVIDKYIGDCVMALWGAPRVVDEECTRAVCAALHLRDNMSLPDARTFLSEFGLSISVRVGIARGLVLAGSMGCSKRLSYTVLGDPVNLAARLETANKQFGTRILINGEVMEKTQGCPGEDSGETPFAWREVGTVQVVGKKEAQRVYEILGMRNKKGAGAAMAFAPSEERERPPVHQPFYRRPQKVPSFRGGGIQYEIPGAALSYTSFALTPGTQAIPSPPPEALAVRQGNRVVPFSIDPDTPGVPPSRHSSSSTIQIFDCSDSADGRPPVSDHRRARPTIAAPLPLHSTVVLGETHSMAPSMAPSKYSGPPGARPRRRRHSRPQGEAHELTAEEKAVLDEIRSRAAKNVLSIADVLRQAEGHFTVPRSVEVAAEQFNTAVNALLLRQPQEAKRQFVDLKKTYANDTLYQQMLLLCDRTDLADSPKMGAAAEGGYATLGLPVLFALQSK